MGFYAEDITIKIICDLEIIRGDWTGPCVLKLTAERRKSSTWKNYFSSFSRLLRILASNTRIAKVVHWKSLVLYISEFYNFSLSSFFINDGFFDTFFSSLIFGPKTFIIAHSLQSGHILALSIIAITSHSHDQNKSNNKKSHSDCQWILLSLFLYARKTLLFSRHFVDEIFTSLVCTFLCTFDSTIRLYSKDKRLSNDTMLN